MADKKMEQGFSEIEEEKKRLLASIKNKRPAPMEEKEEKKRLVEKVKEEKKSPFPRSVQDAVEARTKDLKVDKPEITPTPPKKKAKVEQPSVLGQFKEALTFFAPTIIGGIGGALIEGTEGAVAGAEQGTSLGESFRDFKMKEKELALKQGKLEPSSFEKQKEDRIKAHQDASLKFKAEERKSIVMDQELRRFERSQEQVTKLEENFGKQKHIEKELEVLRQIQSLNDLAEAKVLPGTIGFKLAKGIAGEVGNLTDAERKAAEIEPSIWNRIERYAAKTFKGEIPQDDVVLIKKTGSKLRGKIEGRLRTAADRYSKARKNQLHEAHATTFRDDLLLGINIDPNSEPIKKPAIKFDRRSLEAELQKRGL